jgi:hypothetical protein
MMLAELPCVQINRPAGSIQKPWITVELADRRRHAPVGRGQPLHGGNGFCACNKFGLLRRIAAGRILPADGSHAVAS